MAYSESDILRVLDKSFEAGDFPVLGNTNIDFITGQLLGFRDNNNWAIVFNWITWSPHGDGPDTIVEAYGNCIEGDSGFSLNTFLPCDPKPFWDEETELKRLNIEIRGYKIPSEDIQEHPDAKNHPERGFRLLSHLAIKYKELLLATDQEYRQSLPPGIPKILSVDNWVHTDFDSPPSEVETFQLLAKVLTTGFPNHYRPTRNVVMNWKDWIHGI